MVDPNLPAAIRDLALACAKQLDACRAEADIDWAYPNPAALTAPGERTGTFRVGAGELLVDADGNWTITMEDLAVALIDEAERPQHHPDPVHGRLLTLASDRVGARAQVHDDCPVGYDEDLANRVRELICAQAGVSERKMFGGLAFLVNGHMSVVASRQGGLMVRVNPAETDGLLAKPHVSPFVMRGRPLQGWLRVDPVGLRTRRQLERWVTRGVTHASSLAPKPGHELRG